MREIVELLLAAPDGQLDESAKTMIRLWDDVPKAVQILKVLDISIYAALGSGIAITVMQVMYEHALKTEGITREDVVRLAYWRTNGTIE